MLFSLAWGKSVGRSRRGRKRKEGARYPSGGLKPAPAEKDPGDRVRTSRQPHRRVLEDSLRLSEEAESPLGRLHLSGALRSPSNEDADVAAARYQAGELYAQIVGTYRSVIETPRSTAGSGVGFGCLSQHGEATEKPVRLAGRVFVLREWPCQRDPDGCGCARRKARYDDAFEALMTAGQRAAKAVARVAVHREAISAEDRVYLVLGLTALARHFGLTGRRPRAHSGNTH